MGLKIALITDLHISSEEEKPLDIPVREQFSHILKIAARNAPELIILNGDLCHKTGDKAVYEWIKSEMDNTGIPYLGLPGNHDDAVLMYETFNWPITNGEMYYQNQLHDQNFVFLDSSSGKISAHQLNWLVEIIQKECHSTHFIFMHHPPLLCNSIHMEPAYALENMEDFRKVLSQFSKINFHIFSGHYHMEATASQENIMVYVTPSTFFQIDPHSSSLRKLNNLIGYRNIEISENKRLITSLHYLIYKGNS